MRRTGGSRAHNRPRNRGNFNLGSEEIEGATLFRVERRELHAETLRHCIGDTTDQAERDGCWDPAPAWTRLR